MMNLITEIHVIIFFSNKFKIICLGRIKLLLQEANFLIMYLHIKTSCPIKSEKTHASWYWSVTENTEAAYKLSTKPIPMFKLSSTEVVYLHCAIKLCVAGFENQCPLLTEVLSFLSYFCLVFVFFSFLSCFYRVHVLFFQRFFDLFSYTFLAIKRFVKKNCELRSDNLKIM